MTVSAVRLMFTAVWLVGCAQSPEAIAQAEEQWARARRDDVAQTLPGWSAPRRLEPISTPGWEDGAYVSPDGDTVYFVYTDIDVFRFPLSGRTGPDRDPQRRCFLGCGRFPRADLFVSQRRAEGWSEPQIHPLTVKRPIGGFVLAHPDRAYFMYSEEDDDGWGPDIGVADREGGTWGEPRRILSVSSEHTDRDPWVGADESELWFSSERPASLGQENIWISVREGNGWAAPVVAPQPINSERMDMQPFLHGGYVYFASNREGALAIYRSRRNGSLFGRPEKVIWSRHGVGEPTLSADGRTLVFVQVFRDGNASTIDLMEIRKVPSIPPMPPTIR